MDLCDFEGIIKANINNICENVLDYVSDIEDGVAQINVETGELYYCGLGKNTSENPLNKCVEVYRLDCTIDKEDICECYSDCEDYYTPWFDCEDCKYCMCDGLIMDFKDNFDDIISDVQCQIQEWGYDLL
ncbi:MAG: hypothetical protein IKG40_01610 [Bacilli bacterium]|nr:hypothetical protein [Bacilli bacterium]